MKHQVVVIHGGESFRTRKEYMSFLRRLRIDFGRYLTERYDWKGTLRTALGRRFEVIMPVMPNKLNAKYLEWKLLFEKLIPHLRHGVVLVGHSLGGLFLAKFLSEVRFPKKIRAVLLLSAPFSHGNFPLSGNLKKLAAKGGKIFLYHSKDDRVVQFSDFLKYKKSLPSAVARTFQNRGHFNQPRFPELVRDIKGVFARR